MRWDAFGFRELQTEAANSDSQLTNTTAIATNENGEVVGGTELNAARWNSAGSLTVLGNVGDFTDGRLNSVAYAINAAGTATGTLAFGAVLMSLGARRREHGRRLSLAVLKANHLNVRSGLRVVYIVSHIANTG